MNEAREINPPSLLSPEGILMLIIAVLLDVLGIILLVLPGLGWITTIFGLTTIGIWSWIRLGNISGTKRAMKFLRRVGLNSLGELLTAGVYPGWTITVFMVLKK